MPDAAEVTEAVMDVRFIINPDMVEILKRRAHMIDDENIGGHLAEYTVQQALTVVWHNDPDWLHTVVLTGWTVEEQYFDEAPTQAPDTEACRHCGQDILPDGQNGWTDVTDGDACSALEATHGVHAP